VNPYDEGYHAGLVNDRDNPHSVWSSSLWPWHFGNLAGLAVHCAIVEAVYLSEEQ
jgi:hypothetical protein